MREKLPSRGFLRKLLVFLAICWVIVQMFAYARLFNAYTCVESTETKCRSKASVEHSRKVEAWVNGVVATIFVSTGVVYVLSCEK